MKKMVGRVGYAPTTPAMSMQYSTIELTALFINKFIIISIFKIKNICFLIYCIHNAKINHK